MIISKHLRPILKSISYRILSMFVTFLIGWSVTGDISVGLKLGAIDFCIKLGLYYFHELAWTKKEGDKNV